MKFTKQLLVGTAAAAAITVTSLAPVANAEVSGSVGVATSYLWRGFDLGTNADTGTSSGIPAISGSLDYSEGLFYAGVWASSGDKTAGLEYDLYAGLAGAAGEFSWDVGLITYVYPRGQFSTSDGQPGDFAEVIVNLGYGPVSVFYHDNIAGETTKSDGTTGGYAFTEDYSYLGISATYEAYTITIAKHDEEGVNKGNPGVTGNAAHLDLAYAYNDNLSFTLSTIIESDLPSDAEQEPTFVVSYSLPIK